MHHGGYLILGNEFVCVASHANNQLVVCMNVVNMMICTAVNMLYGINRHPLTLYNKGRSADNRNETELHGN